MLMLKHIIIVGDLTVSPSSIKCIFLCSYCILHAMVPDSHSALPCCNAVSWGYKAAASWGTWSIWSDIWLS